MIFRPWKYLALLIVRHCIFNCETEMWYLIFFPFFFCETLVQYTFQHADGQTQTHIAFELNSSKANAGKELGNCNRGVVGSSLFISILAVSSSMIPQVSVSSRTNVPLG